MSTSQEVCHGGALNRLYFPIYNILVWVSKSKVDIPFLCGLRMKKYFKDSRVIYSLENSDGNIAIDEIRGCKNNYTTNESCRGVAR